jgi:hypothetical protein
MGAPNRRNRMPTIRKLIEREIRLARTNLPMGMPTKPAVMVISLKGIGVAPSG